MPENGWKQNAAMHTETKTIYIHQSNIDVYKAMATDEYLLQCVSSGNYCAAVHVYSWLQPCITLGRFTPSDIIKNNCSINITRRITGGNALYHKDDIAYAVIVKLGDNKNIGLELYQSVSEVIQKTLSEFQINTKLISNDRNITNRRLPCNETFSRCELMYFDEKKATAAAQKNNRLAILQQGSIYLNHQPEAINKYLKNNSGIVNASNEVNIDKNCFMKRLEFLLAKKFKVEQKDCKSHNVQSFIDNLIENKYRNDEWVWQNFR